MRTVIIGGRHVGQKLSERLIGHGDTVVFLDDDAAVIKRALGEEIDAHETDISDLGALAAVDLDPADTVIVATDSDSQNLLVAQLLRVTFDVDHLIVLVNNPQNLAPFDELDVEIVNSTEALATAIEDKHSGTRNH